MILYAKGDCIAGALRQCELSEATQVVVHGCNDIAAWGAGFTHALDVKNPSIGEDFRARGPQPLGSVTFASIGRVHVANLVTQHGVLGRTTPNVAPIRYDAVHTAMGTLARHLARFDGPVHVHMPRIGCGLAGGTWDRILPAVEQLTEYQVTVWDL